MVEDTQSLHRGGQGECREEGAEEEHAWQMCVMSSLRKRREETEERAGAALEEPELGFSLSLSPSSSVMLSQTPHIRHQALFFCCCFSTKHLMSSLSEPYPCLETRWELILTEERFKLLPQLLLHPSVLLLVSSV